MPFLGVGLHLLVALYFGIHAIRRGANMYWLLILFSFPLLGSVVYFFAMYLPELRSSHTARAAGRAVMQVVDPGRAVREARHAFDLTPTVDRRLRLAQALLEAGQADEALSHYNEAAQGPFATDGALLRGLAATQLALGQAEAARATLEQLFVGEPDARRNAQVALLYARALAATQAAGAREAFTIALNAAGDAEPKCRFADWLIAQGGADDRAQAQALYAQIIKDSAHWHKHARGHNAEWLRRAQAATQK